MIYKKLVRFLKRIFKKKRKSLKRKKSRLKKIPTGRRISPKVSKRKKPHRKISDKKKVKKNLKDKNKLVLAAQVTHYFPKVNAAVIKLKKTLYIGMPVLIKGNNTNFRQTVGSMQMNHKPIDKGMRGQEVGLEVLRPVVSGDNIYEVKIL